MRALGKGSIAEIIRVGLLIAWIVLWVAATICGIVVISYGLNAAGLVDLHDFWGPRAHFHMDVGGSRIETPPGAPTWPVIIPAFLIAAVAITGGLMIVFRLRKLFDSFCSGEPFARENATHLRAIWITMLGVEVARYMLLLLTGALLTAYGDAATAHADIKLNINLSTWASILILIVLAEVFREGARLKREQELTI